MSYLLLFSVFIIATCGLVYELIHAAIASYLLGDSITQFSTVIGVYLFSMGIGSYLSKYVKKNLIHVFIRVELIIGLLGMLLGVIVLPVSKWIQFSCSIVWNGKSYWDFSGVRNSFINEDTKGSVGI